MSHDLESVRRLLIAAALDEAELVVDYVEHLGVNPDSTWGGKPTALGYAALHGNTALVAFLVERGADSNHRDDLDMTPLHYAALGGNVDCYAMLLDHGACEDVVNRFGKRPANLKGFVREAWYSDNPAYAARPREAASVRLANQRA